MASAVRVAAPCICFVPWSGTRILQAAAPTATSCFCRRQRSSLLHSGHSQRKIYFLFRVCRGLRAAPNAFSRKGTQWKAASYQASGSGVSLRTVRWGGTLLPKAIGRAMEWPATATTAASGGNRKLLLGQRPAGCECRSKARSIRWVPQPVLVSEEKATDTLAVKQFTSGSSADASCRPRSGQGRHPRPRGCCRRRRTPGSLYRWPAGRGP